MTPPKTTILHGACIAIDKTAVFLRGASDAGMSDLAFRLIEAGAKLVSDGQVEFTRRAGVVYAAPAEAVRGILEVRGVGLVKYPPVASCALKLVIDLSPREAVPHIPQWDTADILGAPLPRLKLHAFDPSTPAKIRLAARVLERPELLAR